MLVNSHHYVRALAFDNSNYVFTNYSSVANPITSSNENMLKLYPLKDDLHSQIVNNVYDKRRVEVYNLTGTVYINAEA